MQGAKRYFELELPEPEVLPELPELPEPEVLGELLEGEVELELPELPLLPEDPVELELDLSKYCCHSERDTWPSPFLSTELKLGDEDEPEALLPPEAPLEPVLLLMPEDPEDPVLLEPPAEDDGLDEEDEDGLDEDGLDADGLDADEPLLDDLSPAPIAVVAKPRNAAVTAALMSFNVMDEVSFDG